RPRRRRHTPAFERLDQLGQNRDNHADPDDIESKRDKNETQSWFSRSHGRQVESINLVNDKEAFFISASFDKIALEPGSALPVHSAQSRAIAFGSTPRL